MEKKGVFIVFEGIDGSGKTYHLKVISEELRKLGYNIVSTKEPSKSSVGTFLHHYVRQDRSPLLPKTEALLFAADRLEHVKRVITPTLRKGRIVITDRYFYSSIAYQGASGVNIDWIKELNQFAPKPDLCFLFDILPDYSLYRTKRKRTKFEDVDYLRKVRNIYNNLVEQEKLIKVDADRSRKIIKAELLSIIINYLQEKSDEEKF